MFRFLLLILVVGGIGLYFTNPSIEDVRTQIDAQVATQTSAGIAMPDGQGGLPQAVSGAVSDRMQSQIQVSRTNYQLFSIFKVSIGPEGNAHELPGCLIGIAKQAIPYDKC